MKRNLTRLKCIKYIYKGEGKSENSLMVVSYKEGLFIKRLCSGAGMSVTYSTGPSYKKMYCFFYLEACYRNCYNWTSVGMHDKYIQ